MRLDKGTNAHSSLFLGASYEGFCLIIMTFVPFFWSEKQKGTNAHRKRDECVNITFVPVFFDIRSFPGATSKTTPQLHSFLFLNAFVPFFSAFVPFFWLHEKRNECGSQASICYIRAFKQKRNECAFVPFLFAFVPVVFAFVPFFWRVSKKERMRIRSFF